MILQRRWQSVARNIFRKGKDANCVDFLLGYHVVICEAFISPSKNCIGFIDPSAKMRIIFWLDDVMQGSYMAFDEISRVVTTVH